MEHAALFLAVLGLLLGLWPLHPRSHALGLLAAVAGILPAVSALLLALKNRSRALREQRRLELPTATLGLAVAATLTCSAWLLAVLLIFSRSRHP